MKLKGVSRTTEWRRKKLRSKRHGRNLCVCHQWQHLPKELLLGASAAGGDRDECSSPASGKGLSGLYEGQRDPSWGYETDVVAGQDESNSCSSEASDMSTSSTTRLCLAEEGPADGSVDDCHGLLNDRAGRSLETLGKVSSNAESNLTPCNAVPVKHTDDAGMAEFHFDSCCLLAQAEEAIVNQSGLTYGEEDPFWECESDVRAVDDGCDTSSSEDSVMCTSGATQLCFLEENPGHQGGDGDGDNGDEDWDGDHGDDDDEDAGGEEEEEEEEEGNVERGNDSDASVDGDNVGYVGGMGDNIEPNDSDPDDPDDPDNVGGSSDSGDSDEDQDVNFSFGNVGLNAVCRTVIDSSVREVLAVLLALATHHRLTYDATIGMMTGFNALYGRKYLPIDKKPLWLLLGRSTVGITKYAYCPSCLRGHGRLRAMDDEVQCVCHRILKKKTCSYFINLNVRKQIQDLLRKPEVLNGLRYRREREIIGGSMRDILDGCEYLRLRQQGNVLESNLNYSYSFNLDGFRLAKSSTAEAWPIYLKWNELPPKLRQKYMLLAGVWIDLQHPNMNLILEPFINEANHLSNVGVRWTPEGQAEEVMSKFIPTCCVVDAQARSPILNFTSPSGYCGCPFCDHRGLHIGGCVHFPFLPPIPVPVRRTDNEIRRCMLEAAQGPGEVLGFKGASQLILLDHFNLSKGVVTDDMHPFAGVIQHHTEILLTRTRQYRPPYYIGDSLGRIDSRLLTIRTPSHISRKPRSLKRRKKWKSSEWRNWLLYYAVPCLEGILPRQYHRHLQLLAQAIYLVSKSEVSEQDCRDADHMFRRYVELFERYFGAQNMRYNTHILLHVVDCVKEWGPMFAQSTSFFEGWNHALVQTVTSPTARADQIVTRFLIKRFLDNIDDDENISERIKVQVNRILNQPRLRDNIRVGEVTLLGRSFQRAPTAREQQLLEENNVNINYFLVFKRADVGGVEYRSADYRYAGLETKSDDSHVLTLNDEFGQILTIALMEGDENERRIVVFLKILNTNAHVNRYVCRVDVGEDVIDLQSFDSIQGHAVFCNIPAAGSFVMPITNAWELD